MADVKIVIGGDAAGAAAAAKTAEASLQRMGAAGQVSAGQTANAMRMLPAQLTDVVTQLQGGASPLTVLIQQGGQVKDMFGGFGPMFTALASAISPVMVAAGAVAAGVGAVALALYQGHAQSETFNRSLILTGNYAGATAGQMDLMADSVSQGAQVTIGAAREITAAAVATGAFGPQSIGAVSQAMAALQHASGATTQDVVSDFASMSKGVAAWTAEHNRQYNFLTAAQWEYIRTLERQGQKEAAMVEASKLLEQSLAGRRQDLGYLEGMWRDVADAASKAWDAMLGWGRSDDSSKTADLVKSMKAAQERLAEAQSDPARWKMLGGSDEEVAKLQAELDDLRDRYVRVTTEAAQKAKAQAAEQTKIDDARSGRTAAAGNARVDRDLANEAWATQAWLAEIDLRQKAEDAAHQLGLSSLAQYEQQRIALIQMERDARIASLSEQIRLEKSRPVKGDTPKEVEAQQLQSEVRVTQLRAQITAAMDAAARDVATAQAAIAADAVQTARDRAQQWADEWLKADARVKQLAQDTLTARTALIQDPNARAQAEAAQQIEQLKRQRDQDLVPAQRALSLAPNEEAAAELQRRIDEVMGAYADRIGAVHDTLADRLKPGWQKLIDGWQNTNAVMRDGYATMIDGVVKDGEGGAAVAGAIVKLTDASGKELTATADGNGNFRLDRKSTRLNSSH